MSIEQNGHDAIPHILKGIAENSFTETEQSIAALNTLEAFECWKPYTALIQQLIRDPKKRKIIYYVRLAKMQYQYLEDIFSAAETCTSAVSDLKLSFERFYQILKDILAPDDWTAEAVILQSSYNKFSDLKDKIECLERLALIYEKKTHDSEALRNTFETLLQINPYNIKALRYYKLVFTQNGEWSEALAVMRKLLEASRHPQDIYRLAQEMATVYLYHLDKPKQAIDIIETHCKNSPLDTSMIHYDAYERLGDLEKCIQIVASCLPRVANDQQRAALHYKAGLLEERLGKPRQALNSYHQALQFEAGLLLCYERITAILAKSENWEELIATLQRFKTVVVQRESIENVESLIQRFRFALGSKNG